MMDSQELVNKILWIVVAADTGGVNVCGVYSSEEIAVDRIKPLVEAYPDAQFWICPCVKDILVGGDEDELIDMPDRVYRLYDEDMEVSFESVTENITLETRKRHGLHVVK